jgi:hypothetical protein
MVLRTGSRAWAQGSFGCTSNPALQVLFEILAQEADLPYLGKGKRMCKHSIVSEQRRLLGNSASPNLEEELAQFHGE